MAKKRKVVKKGKRQRKQTKSTRKGDFYKGEPKRTCPKCGAGVFMAEHKDRHHCGKCSYTEFKNV